MAQHTTGSFNVALRRFCADTLVENGIVPKQCPEVDPHEYAELHNAKIKLEALGYRYDPVNCECVDWADPRSMLGKEKGL